MTEDDSEGASQRWRHRALGQPERTERGVEHVTEDDSERGPRDPVRRSAARAASRARRIGGAVPRPARAPQPESGRPAVEPEPEPSRSAPEPEASRSAPEPEATRDQVSDPDSQLDTGEDTRPAEPAPRRARVGGRRPSPVPRTRAGARADSDRERAVRRARMLRWVPAMVAAALVIALAVVDVLLLSSWRDQPGKAERREQLVASVNGGIAKVLSYDYRHLDADETAASARLTGKFKDQYVASMNTTIKPKAPTEKAVVVGEVGSTAVTSVSGDGKQAVLLVLGQQTITNAKQTTPRYDPVSLRVTAALVHGTWLISDLATL